jgi:hypothetical protein
MAGRSREHDRDKIAKDLIEWAKKPDSINLNKFCCSYKPPFSPRKISEWGKEDDEFRESVEIAKAFLAARREEWLNGEMLHIKGYDLNAPVYDYFIKQEKREQAEFDSALRTKEDGKRETEIKVVVTNGLGSGIDVSAERVPKTDHTGTE